MYFLFALFSASLAGILAMLVFRGFEIKTGRARIQETAESIVSTDVIEKLLERFPEITQEQAAAFCREFLHQCRKASWRARMLAQESKIADKIRQAINNANGGNGVSKKISQSQFFRAIAEHKKSIKNNRNP